jgi:uncharacterized membrane protein YfcA
MTEIIVFALIASLGMLVQSTVGFAGALVAIPLLALVMSPHEAVPPYAVMMLLVNSFLVWEAREHIDGRRVRRMLVGGVPGVLIGALALKYLPATWLEVTISAATLVFGLLFLTRVRVRFPEHPATEPLIGLLSGLLGGSISAPGPPVVVYALARGWGKDVFRSSLLAYFLCLSASGTLCYFVCGMVTGRMILLSLVALPPAFVASRMGVWMKQRIGERMFRLAVLMTILLASVCGLLKHVTGSTGGDKHQSKTPVVPLTNSMSQYRATESRWTPQRPAPSLCPCCLKRRFSGLFRSRHTGPATHMTWSHYLGVASKPRSIPKVAGPSAHLPWANCRRYYCYA